MIKLSKTQTEVIKRLQAGEILHHVTGLYARCFFSNDRKNISWATIGKLEELDLISRMDRQIILTQKGKEYK